MNNKRKYLLRDYKPRLQEKKKKKTTQSSLTGIVVVSCFLFYFGWPSNEEKNLKTETQMEQYNESLSIWNSVLGEQNELGLMPTPKIKLREKHPHFMAFNMNY